MATASTRRGSGRRVLLLELNEITSTILDPMLARGQLPAFAKLKREGAWGEPTSVERPPYLDPWITWVTVHTGVDRGVHGASVLEQDASTLRAPRTWQYAAKAGLSVGVFGSISAHPPEPVEGFMVPGPFAPTSATFPAELSPIQDLNRGQTRLHGQKGEEESLPTLARRAFDLARLGLRPGAIGRAMAQILREQVWPYERHRRCLVQPFINFDLFSALYREHRPAYATFHTNHAAHMMHHYWRAMDDRGFPVRASAEEKERYGRAVELGYRACDEILARTLAMVGPDTVVVVASSMGQQPFVAERFPGGRVVMRIRDIHRLLALVGAKGVTEVVPVMVPQWNVRIPDPKERARVCDALRASFAVGAPHRETFHVDETGEILTIGPRGLAKRGAGARYFFPGSEAAEATGYSEDELFVMDAPTPKQGMHHPRGVLGLLGAGIAPGVSIEESTNLDIAPTILSMLGVPIPTIMKGRVLVEAFGGERPRARESSSATPPVTLPHPRWGAAALNRSSFPAWLPRGREAK